MKVTIPVLLTVEIDEPNRADAVALAREIFRRRNALVGICLRGNEVTLDAAIRLAPAAKPVTSLPVALARAWSTPPNAAFVK